MPSWAGLFPDTAYFRDWLARGTSDYLVLMTGDGAYRFADVRAIIALLEQQQSLGGVFGSRTQSRRQFITSVRAAYGENRLLYWLGKVAAFILSTLFYLRTGIIVSRSSRACACSANALKRTCPRSKAMRRWRWCGS